MKIKTALVLCAGFGKRLNPITLKTPKPLIKINNLTLLENTLNLLQKLGIESIKINTFHLGEQINNFVNSHHLKNKIQIISDGNQILDTGGGILNLMNSSKENDFLILNPDTLWNSNYINIFNNMEKYYFKNKAKNLLMVVKKNKSFDTRFKGDFNLNGNKLSKDIKNEFIYTGCQILNRKIFQHVHNNIFSISKIWNRLLDKNELFGYESKNDFVHLTDAEIFNKLN